MQNGQTEPVGGYPTRRIKLHSLYFYIHRNSWLVPLLRLSQKMVTDHFLKKEKLRSVKDSLFRESY